jgi:hypothetical protein
MREEFPVKKGEPGRRTHTGEMAGLSIRAAKTVVNLPGECVREGTPPKVLPKGLSLPA